jgi:predicted Ser/Thr protein kinase
MPDAPVQPPSPDPTPSAAGTVIHDSVAHEWMKSLTQSDTPALPTPDELTALLPHGNYQVEGLLGQGGMGAVYAATQVRLKRPVAIKIMRRDQGLDHDFEPRFEREALALAKLNHPHIVSVIDYGEAGPDYLYIVMEMVDGADLMSVIRAGHMTQDMALALLPQICDALQFAHDHGIVHRDIKPGNILLTRDGRIKIADFGLARLHDTESSALTQTGTGMGTPDYAAPEQFQADAQIDHRADIYALGVMIYQMITGELPRGVWRPPSERAPVAPQWDDIVRHAMQTDPADRYQKASEIKTDVSKITPASGRAVSPKPPPTTPQARSLAGAPTKSRAPLLLGVALVISIAAFLAHRWQQPAAIVPAKVATTDPYVWRSLFDGKTLAGWKDNVGKWRVEDGLLVCDGTSYLRTLDSFGDFELEFEWRIGAHADSGVKYRMDAVGGRNVLEFQITSPPRAGTGSLQDLYPETQAASHAVGQWNTGRILVIGTRGEHWVNGEKVCSYDIKDDDFRDKLARLGFGADHAFYGTARPGPILLQGLKGQVAFRSLRLRVPTVVPTAR